MLLRSLHHCPALAVWLPSLHPLVALATHLQPGILILSTLSTHPRRPLVTIARDGNNIGIHFPQANSSVYYTLNVSNDGTVARACRQYHLQASVCVPSSMPHYWDLSKGCLFIYVSLMLSEAGADCCLKGWLNILYGMMTWARQTACTCHYLLL